MINMHEEFRVFADRVGLIVAMENGGKISPQDAFDRIGSVWEALTRKFNESKHNR